MSGAIASVAIAQQSLFVAYPPNGHETTAQQIFLVGTAPPGGTVTVNDQPIPRSPAGHFAPSFPLQSGTNTFILRYADQELTIQVKRTPEELPTPVGVAFAEGSLTPAVALARLPGEPVCFGAIAPTNATVTVTLHHQTIPLLPQSTMAELPPNAAVLTATNDPIARSTATANATLYQGCTTDLPVGALGQPEFRLTLNGQTVRQMGPGAIAILAPTNPQVIEVTSEAGAARTGPSTDYSRLTPLPKGTRAAVTGQEGEWLRLDYGAWIRANETQPVPNALPPHTLIRSIRGQQTNGWTEIVFPLQMPVPVTVFQGDRTFTLTLHHTTAQTDTIWLDDDPLIERLDWQQTTPDQVQYIFNLKTNQQWGYRLHYAGTSLVLGLRHPPQGGRGGGERGLPLEGISILLDPGHGGPEDLGSRGPTGYPEKEVTLLISNLLQEELQRRGATVYMTRTADVDLGLRERIDQINRLEPAIALSLHYNALPDQGDALNTAGVGTFWYNTQAHSLAVFLHNYLVEQLDRPSYGVFWNNLALTRPTVAPAVLLELGFMINPTEFEWITNAVEQQRLVTTLADGITAWLRQNL